jgi:hypothetical protein
VASAEVLPVPKGSLIVLTDIDLNAYEDRPDGRDPFAVSIAEGLGHDEFVLVSVRSGGAVQVLTDPAEFPEWLADALVDAAARRKNYLDDFVAQPVDLPTVEVAPDTLSR